MAYDVVTRAPGQDVSPTASPTFVTLNATTLTDGTATLTGGVLTSATGLISQWTNDVSYLTAEVDTLATVCARGSASGSNVTIGDTTNDVTLTFDGGNNGIITWMEDEREFHLPYMVEIDPPGYRETNYPGQGAGVFVGRTSTAVAYDAALAFVQRAGASTTSLLGIFGYVVPQSTHAHTEVVGVLGWVDQNFASASGAITSVVGVRGQIDMNSSENITNMICIEGVEYKRAFAAPTPTNSYYFKGTETAAIAATNKYGLWLPAIDNGSSSNWSIYTQGGDIGIIADNTSLVFGAGSDASIQYNGTNLLVNPKDVGSGVVLLDTDSKLCPRDTAIGIYSQADTFLDLFADGAVRIGDSSAGAPTNYANFAPDGELTLHGTARVSRETWVPATGLKAPGTKPATSVEIGISSAWEFTDATDDTLTGNISVPNNVDVSENVSFTIGWSSPTADPGDDSKQAVWQLEYALHAPGQDMDGAAETTKTATASASTTADGLVMTEITGISEVEAGDVCFEFRLKRLGADGDDDLGDVAHVHGVCMKFVSNKLGAAT